MTAVDEAPPQGISVVSFLRSRNAPDFGQAEQSTLHAFLPHFRHCIRIQRRLMTFASRVHLLEDTLAASEMSLDVKLFGPSKEFRWLKATPVLIQIRKFQYIWLLPQEPTRL